MLSIFFSDSFFLLLVSNMDALRCFANSQGVKKVTKKFSSTQADQRVKIQGKWGKPRGAAGGIRQGLAARPWLWHTHTPPHLGKSLAHRVKELEVLLLCTINLTALRLFTMFALQSHHGKNNPLAPRVTQRCARLCSEGNE